MIFYDIKKLERNQLRKLMEFFIENRQEVRVKL